MIKILYIIISSIIVANCTFKKVVKHHGVPFLDKKPNKSIKRIHKKADLVDAYRLGIGAFDTTDVDSDIIVLRKK